MGVWGGVKHTKPYKVYNMHCLTTTYHIKLINLLGTYILFGCVAALLHVCTMGLQYFGQNNTLQFTDFFYLCSTPIPFKINGTLMSFQMNAPELGACFNTCCSYYMLQPHHFHMNGPLNHIWLFHLTLLIRILMHQKKVCKVLQFFFFKPATS